MTGELHTLTGAYALNALPENEREEFKRHLANCETCYQEVLELRETAARLGAATAIEPPAELRKTVLARVAQTRQQPPSVHSELDQRRRAKSWPTRLAFLGAAAAIVVAIVFGVKAIDTDQRLDANQQQLAAINAVLTAPDAITVKDSVVSTEADIKVVVSRDLDKAVVLAANLPQLSPEQVYQLWFIGPGGPQSAGLMQPESPNAGSPNTEPSKEMRPMLANMADDINRVGVTVEPAGGSLAPTTPAVSMLPLS